MDTNSLLVQNRTEEDLRSAFWEQVNSFPEGDKIKNCLQCGTCTGSCPVSDAMDITPRQTIALFRAGLLTEILESRTIWICVSCYSCTVRCPVGIRVTDSLYALKRIAMEKKIYPDNFPVYALSKIFTSNVYRYGRNYELGLGIRFFLRSDFRKLFKSIGVGYSMISRGRMGLIPKRIKKIDEVQAIIDKANQLGEE